MKKLAIFLGTLICTLGIIALVSGQIPTILPCSPITCDVTFKKDVIIEGTLFPAGITSTSGEFAFTTSDSTIFKLSSISGIDNQVVEIIGGEALDAGEHWTGLRIKPDDLDPSGVDTRIRGIALNMSGIDPGVYDMDLDALRIVMPDNGYDAIRIKEGKIRHLQTIPDTAYAAFTTHDIVIDASAQVSTSESHALDVTLASTLGGGHVAAVGTHVGVDPIHQHIGTFTSFGANYAGRLTSGPTYTDNIDDQNIWVAKDDSILVGHTAKFDEINLVFTTPATKDCFLKFYFYQTATGWVQFYPRDGTDGGRQDGVVGYSSDDLTNWQSDYDPGTGADAGYWIKILRNRTNSPGTVTLKTGEYLAAITYYWDKSGDVSINALTVTGFIGTSYYNCGNSGASITIDWNNGNLQYVTLTAVGVDITFTEPPHPGKCELWIIQDGTGNRTIDWEHEISPKWPGAVAPTLSTAAAAVDVVVFTFVGGTTYRGLFNGDFR